ncbi:MAG: TrkH family potassium uptake protein [Lachnospiraceae bacterium]|nr:TrkH family potassium uptake protein [Lachnospiraceae bacterium]
MNLPIIRYILGHIIKLEGLFLLLPFLVALLYRESTAYTYLSLAVAGFAIGFLLTRRKPENTVFYLKEGCVTTALSWIALSLLGCLPFYFTGEIPSFTDALFETVSGFTTTGASILSDVEALSHSSLFWRSFTHWIGGMGVLVFLLAIIPLSGGSHINLLRAESPGPSVGKLVPKMKTTARILYLIYLAMTIIEILILFVSGMPLFDSVTLSFGTAGTGGFGVKNSSLADYTAFQQWVVTIFMILFGINFNAYYLLLFKSIRQAFKIEEVRWYLAIIAASTGVIFLEILDTMENGFQALTHAAFQVASIITTTGYSTLDFNAWSSVCKVVLVLLMFIGACAGSTGGGIKVSRILILFKAIRAELTSYIHPKSIRRIKMDDKPLEDAMIHSVNVYIATFVILFTASVFVISFDGHDLITNFTAVAATINNIGPGLELVGPASNFGFFSPLSKYVMIFDMLAGRLELFPLLLLFHPRVWKA